MENTIAPIKPTELEKTAASYRYDEALFRSFEQDIWNRMRRYSGDFGQTMIQHLYRTSKDFADFLRTQDYPEQSVVNLASAFRLHDAGKILQSPTLWGLDEKPSDNVRRQRKEHVDLGARVLEETLERHSQLKGHPHLQVTECLMRHHHERVNGSGPHRLSGQQLGQILEIAGIIDTVDGKILPRGSDRNISPDLAQQDYERKRAEALRDMTGLPAYTRKDKHHGEFSIPLLMKVIDFYQKDMDVWVLPKPSAQQYQSLAL